MIVIGNVEPYILSFIRSAKRRLILVSPWISPRFAELAVQKQREGVPTVVITTYNKERGHRVALGTLLEKKSLSRRFFFKRKKIVSRIEALYVVDKQLHAKIYVADDKVIIGSANLTAQKNIESIVLTSASSTIIQQIEKLLNTFSKVAVFRRE